MYKINNSISDQNISIPELRKTKKARMKAEKANEDEKNSKPNNR